MTPQKILLIILDGASDRPVDGATPLQSAKKSNLDALAKNGICGIMDTISPGVPPGSATAHLAIFGYDPYKYYTGRGPFEAAGVGLEVRKGDVAFRCNFATARDGKIVDRRAGRIRDTKELEKAVNEGVDLGIEFQFRAGTAHRGALLLRAPGLSSDVTPTDPNKEGVPAGRTKATSKKGEKTARIMNDFTAQVAKVLDKHPINKKRASEGKSPANILLLRGAGVVPHIPPFEEKYGLRSAAVAAAGLIIGIARICRMNFIPTEGATGGLDSNLDNKIKNASDALDKYDFVMLNIKGADEAGHDGDFKAKTEFIGKIDDALGRLPRREDILTVVTADHSTPVSVKNHSGDPVPLIISGNGVRVDGVEKYDEINCARGGLNRLRGMDLMPILMDLLGKGKKFGE